MSEKIDVILEHMLEDAQDTVELAKEAGTYEKFASTMSTRKAVVMSLLNIGELAHHLPDSFIAKHPEIPWTRMINMRNLAAHGYHILNLETVWEAAQTFIPELLAFLQKQVPDEKIDS